MGHHFEACSVKVRNILVEREVVLFYFPVFVDPKIKKKSKTSCMRPTVSKNRKTKKEQLSTRRKVLGISEHERGLTRTQHELLERVYLEDIVSRRRGVHLKHTELVKHILWRAKHCMKTNLRKRLLRFD